MTSQATKPFELGPRQLALVEDLETNGHLQGREVLTALQQDCDPPEIDCCLGRACKLAKAERTVRDGMVYYGARRDQCFMPVEVKEYFGFYDHCGSHRDGGEGVNDSKPSMLSMNDVLKLSFKEIAARLRANPEHYFMGPR